VNRHQPQEENTNVQTKILAERRRDAFLFTRARFANAGGAPRTFVSGLGSDANPCARTAPCRTFQHAHDVVDANGEVLALDSAGYGTLNITKNVTISGEGVEATANEGVDPIVHALSGDAIKIATAGLKVVLRSITLEGFGAGSSGINLSEAVDLTIQHCVIHGFGGSGLQFIVSGGTGKLSVSDSRITDCEYGVELQGLNTGTIKATISNTRIENNGRAGLVTQGAKVTIRNSATSGNGVLDGEPGIVVGAFSEVNVESCESSNNGGDGIKTFYATSVVRVSRSVVTDNVGIGLNNNAAGTFETYSFKAPPIPT